MSAEGVIDLQSPYSVAETVGRLQALLLAKGMKIFARIDQAAEAVSVGLTIRPTILILFGNPKAGTPLMEQFPSLAIDLPFESARVGIGGGEGFSQLHEPRFFAGAASFADGAVCAVAGVDGGDVEIVSASVVAAVYDRRGFTHAHLLSLGGHRPPLQLHLSFSSTAEFGTRFFLVEFALPAGDDDAGEAVTEDVDRGCAPCP